jgi:hypothetical protein
LFQELVATVPLRKKFQTVFYVAKETSSFENEKRTPFLTFTQRSSQRVLTFQIKTKAATFLKFTYKGKTPFYLNLVSKLALKSRL